LVRLLTSGGFALSERNTDVVASFEEGNQLATFNFGDIPDLLEKTRYWLDNPKERLEIARRGWEWSANWSWDQQMDKMMRFIDGDDVPADGAASAWVGTLRVDG
jgi:spore maturation protein CgeB